MELFEGLMIVIAALAAGFILGHAVANSYYKKREDIIISNWRQLQLAVGNAFLPILEDTIDDIKKFWMH